MTKKIFAVILVSAILSLCCGFCFAASNEADTVNLGNEISSSLNKGANSVGNVAEDVVGDGEEMVNGVGDAFRRMGDNNNDNNNNNNNNNNNDNNGMWNNGTTDGYSTTRTTAEGTQTTNGTMSTTTWMWIIFAVAAVIIIAAIWYYAMQGNDRD